MKVEARYRNQQFEIEVTEESGSNHPFFHVSVRDKSGKRIHLPVRVLSHSQGRWTLQIDDRIEDVLVSSRGQETLVDWQNRSFLFEIQSWREKLLHDSAGLEVTGAVSVKAQMPGKVIKLLKKEGDAIETGEGVVVIEAMKMQNEIKAPKSGRLVRCKLVEGTTVNAGELLFEVE